MGSPQGKLGPKCPFTSFNKIKLRTKLNLINAQIKHGITLPKLIDSTKVSNDINSI